MSAEKYRKLLEEIREGIKDFSEAAGKFPPSAVFFALACAILIAAYQIKWLKREELIALFAVTLVICCLLGSLFWKKDQWDRKKRPQKEELSGKYFFGIDIGSENIEYCIIDYGPFDLNGGRKNKCVNPEPLYKGSKKTPRRNGLYELEDVCKVTSEIIYELAHKAKTIIAKKPIRGIGIGLPGMVDPVNGTLVKSPSLKWENVRFVHHLVNGDIGAYKGVEWNTIQDVIARGETAIPIKIDNDVRCATRFMWKRCPEDNKNMVCIFIGNGLGSGIVLNGKMFYGKQFYAGEAGHTIISSLIPSGIPFCNCREKDRPRDGHWEAHVCSYGMVNAMENLLNDQKRISSDGAENFRREYLQGPVDEGEVTNTIRNDAEFQKLSGNLLNMFFENSNGNELDFRKEAAHSIENLKVSETAKKELFSLLNRSLREGSIQKRALENIAMEETGLSALFLNPLDNDGLIFKRNAPSLIDKMRVAKKTKQELTRHWQASQASTKLKKVNTYIISAAYYNNNHYVMQIVENFFEYVAIGVANYINILNPDIVYLGGGMVRGFFYGRKSMPFKISREDFNEKMSAKIEEPDKLWEEMENRGYLDNGWPTMRFNEDKARTRFKNDFLGKYSDGSLNEVIDLLKENSLQKPVGTAFFDIVKNHALPNLNRDDLQVEESEKRYLASMGAALIFKDESYAEYCRNNKVN